ncbi:MAG: polysaccharide deacetylase family protein, partial [Candidatus Latescibacteria bacterium]|nr:polysaccharide deacetylase family protein [Candidatus Latescibacterota bacterium]
DSARRKKYTSIDLTGLKNRKIACLTLDLEQDYGDLLDEPSYEGLSYIDAVVSLFKKRSIPLTCFVQGSLFDAHPYAIEQLSELDVEFEVHGYSHPGPTQIDHEFEISRGKKAFTRFFGREPLAYRSPAGIVSQQMYALLPLYGFRFDSSVIPSLRPGGYFNSLDKPIMPYSLDNSGFVEFPVTVFSRVIRVPISLSYVKLLGKPYFRLLQISNLPALIVFSFHLHDLCTLSSSSKIPFADFSPFYNMTFRRIYGGRSDSGIKLLENLIGLFSSKEYEFLRLVDVYRATAGGDLS